MIAKAPEPVNDNAPEPSQWYLTVRCTGCSQLIAFQKARFPGGNPNLGIAASGELSVHCPNCKSLVRFLSKQIERRNVALTT